jgi:hypothetical protein
MYIWEVHNRKIEIIAFVMIWLLVCRQYLFLIKYPKYEAELDDFVVSLISRLSGYMESIYEWNCLLLI